MGRLIYGAWLAVNGRAYLNGSVDHPTYYFDQSLDPIEGTERIVDYWRERWLLPRLNYQEALDRVAAFRPESLYVSKDVPKKEEIRFKLISAEVSIMTEWAANDQGTLRNFLRNLYRGSSAYADYMDSDRLNSIHVDTGLDKSIVDAVSEGKSIVLTGNPGDGKTHLLRVLKPRLDALSTNPLTELDASRLHDAQLQSMWSDTLAQGRPFCVAINEAVLFNLAKKYPDFAPLQEAWNQVENAVLYDNENVREFSVMVFDLSRRDVLSPKIVNAALDKLTALSSEARCDLCPVEGCDFVRHRELLCTQRFRDRLQLLLKRVSCRGTHATLRELQAFISYMLFAGRSCSELIASSHEDRFALPQLPFKGNGKLFDEIRNTFDPINVAHPLWDEALVNGDTSPGNWLPESTFEEGGLDPSNWDRFVAQKRAFYFFHTKGTDLLQLSGDDESEFIGLLQKNDRDTLRRLIFLINRFFGNIGESDELHVWQSHRYNQSPRRILYSAQVLKRSYFEIKHGRLISSMAQSFDLAQDHFMLRLRSNPQVRLRVDFSLYELLAKAERGVPVMSLEGDASRRLWQFMENLSSPSESSNDAEIHVILLDSTTSERLSLIVDVDERKYLTVTRKGD
jgi:hypothetical protein